MNFARFLTSSALVCPDHPAVIAPGRTVTYGELERRANCLARALLKAGLRSGDRVAIQASNRPEIWEVLLASFKAGIAVTPIHYRLHPEEVKYIVSNCGASLLFREAATSRNEFDARTIAVGHDTGEFEEFLDCGDPEFIEASVTDDSPAWLFYTSGTTGRPKGATLTHRNLEAVALGLLANVDQAKHGDVFIHIGPLSHGSGLCGLHHVIKANTHVLLEAGPMDPMRVIDAIKENKATTTFVVPTMITRLLDVAPQRLKDMRSLHTLIYGGAPCPPALIERARDILGPVLVQLYGQGEAPNALSGMAREDHYPDNSPSWPDRLRSAGRPCAGAEVRIVDDNDCPLPAGQIGEIVARGALVMRGYWQNDAASAETLRGGWLHTGDVGYFDQYGYLYITDRKKEVIISGGMNVYTREVEDVISQHPAVREVAVLGLPDPNWGEIVKAIVALRPATTATEIDIQVHCQEFLASYKKPKIVEFVDELPQGATGKILKRLLK